MVSFLKLIRYQNLLMVLLIMVLTKYALIHSFEISPSLTSLQFILLALSVLCITSSGYIINDIYDVMIDHINKPSKVFVGQTISLNDSWLAYSILSGLGIFIGTYVSFEVQKESYAFIFVASVLVLFLYSKYLKRLPLIGNITIAFLGSFVIYIIYLFETATQQQQESFWDALSRILGQIGVFLFVIYYCIFSFLTTLIREIIKDIVDIDGDYHGKMKTLPILIGTRRAKIVTIAITLLLFLLLCLVTNDFLSNNAALLGAYFIIAILIPIAYFIYALWNAEKKKDFIFLSNFIKIIMLLGILSMLIIPF